MSRSKNDVKKRQRTIIVAHTIRPRIIPAAPSADHGVPNGSHEVGAAIDNDRSAPPQNPVALDSSSSASNNSEGAPLEPVSVVPSQDGLQEVPVTSRGDAKPNGDEADVRIDAAAVTVKFPRCDAAVRNLTRNHWELADAIMAECSEPGADGVRNESYAKMKAMREEIAANHGIDLSFERIRKLRKVAAAFPAGRRRPAVSLEAHLEAGALEKLDALIDSAPKDTPLTREWIRRHKNSEDKAKQHLQKAERRRQVKDQQTSLVNVSSSSPRGIDVMQILRDAGLDRPRLN